MVLASFKRSLVGDSREVEYELLQAQLGLLYFVVVCAIKVKR